MKQLSVQKQLTPNKFVENIYNIGGNGRDPNEQIALFEIAEAIKELVSTPYQGDENYHAMVKFANQVESTLTLNGFEFDEKVDNLEEKFKDGKQVMERDISISFKLLGVYFVFGCATELGIIQLVYQQKKKIYFANH